MGSSKGEDLFFSSSAAVNWDCRSPGRNLKVYKLCNMKHDWQLLRVLLKTIKQSNVVCFVALWYLLSFVGIILNKSLLSPGPHGDAVPLAVLALVQMLFTLVFAQLRQAWDRSFSIRPLRSARQIKHILLLGSLRFLVTVLGLISLSFVAASFTETIKASGPLFTVAAAWLLTGERTSLPVLLTLVPIVLGLAVATKGELSFTMVGFSAAMLGNFLDCVQNVVCSSLLRTKAVFSSHELQYYSAMIALVLTLPYSAGEIWTGTMPLPTQARAWIMLLGAGMVYYLQSALAFNLMSKYSPVTVSVLNTVKRALIICFSSLYFGNIITSTALFGTVVALSGSALYSVLKSSEWHSTVEKAVAVVRIGRGAAEGERLQDSGSSFAGGCRLTIRRAGSGLQRPRSVYPRSFMTLVLISQLSQCLKSPSGTGRNNIRPDCSLRMTSQIKDVRCYAWVSARHPEVRNRSPDLYRWPRPQASLTRSG